MAPNSSSPKANNNFLPKKGSPTILAGVRIVEELGNKEIVADMAAGIVKEPCIRLSARRAAVKLRFPSSQGKTGLSTAGIATKKIRLLTAAGPGTKQI